MARGSRNIDIPGLATQLAGLLAMVFVLGFVSPQFRQLIVSLGYIALCLSLIAAGGFIVCRVTGATPVGQGVGRVEQSRSLPVSIPQETPAARTQLDLLAKLRSIDWFQFEKLVSLIYGKLGYIVTMRHAPYRDGGIDLLVEKDGERSAVRCKHWKAWDVGVGSVREFLGALTDSGIQKGIFITLTGYSGDAKHLADRNGIEIVNEKAFARLLESTDALSDPAIIHLLNDSQNTFG